MYFKTFLELWSFNYLWKMCGYLHFSFWIPITALVTARIFFTFNSSVHSSNIWISYIHNFIFTFPGYITNQFNDQLPVGLLAQLVRALHRYRRSQGSNPGKPDFFQAFFLQLHKLRIITARIFFTFNSSVCSSNIWISYIHNFIPITLAKIYFFPIVITFSKIHLY